MKHLIYTLLLLFTTTALAQLDRTGNVIDSSSGGNGANGLVFAFIGAGIGLAVPLFKPGLSTKFCVIAGAILGAVAGMVLLALK